MNIIRASHLGMCFGVRDAIELAKRTAATDPITVLGQLVHNPSVIADLKRYGIRFANDIQQINTSSVLITAHGASEHKMNQVYASGHQIVEATCPLVRHAHRELRMLVLAGYHPVVIGQAKHVEVLGMTEDLTDFDVIESEADFSKLHGKLKLGIVAQTTQPINRVNRFVDQIREQFPDTDVVFMDTVCRPTKDRQTATAHLAKKSTVVVVIGGRNSNNTRELTKTCTQFCGRVHQVESAANLDADWFLSDDIVGITAGTSTPDRSIDEIESWLENLCQKETNETLVGIF
jgi:4-hydroxy-3-methylbut-2-enyl diphosphate reductase